MPSPYLPNTDPDRQTMLAAIGVASPEELFQDIPAPFRNPSLALPAPLSELELDRELRALAGRNVHGQDYACFLGGGSYCHFVPSVVGHLVARGEFSTSYTPYQPEASQGTLQSTFEFQTLISQLTGMEVSNAGLYDGASALAEAALMACRITGKEKIGLLSTVHPAYQEVVRTYVQGLGLEVQTWQPGQVGPDQSYACLVVQHPNYYGYLEPVEKLGSLARQAGALYVVCIDPISLGLLKPPGEYGADIVVGEGQALGSSLTYGGPYLGLFACRESHVRQMPGRLVGQTTDAQGRRGYVLTLQAREQHIRRERATSNVCTSEALVALTATIYLATLGPHGLRRVAELCYHKAHYAARQIAQIPGYCLPLGESFFKEFVVQCPVAPREVQRRLLEHRILGGIDVSEQMEKGLLLCVTEMNTREEIDRLVAALAGIGPGGKP